MRSGKHLKPVNVAILPVSAIVLVAVRHQSEADVEDEFTARAVVGLGIECAGGAGDVEEFRVVAECFVAECFGALHLHECCWVVADLAVVGEVQDRAFRGGGDNALSGVGGEDIHIDFVVEFLWERLEARADSIDVEIESEASYGRGDGVHFSGNEGSQVLASDV